MPAQLLDAASYAFTVHSVPTLVAATVTLSVGAITLVRERGSTATLPFAAIAGSLLVWMIGSTMLYASVSDAAAGFWVLFGTVGIVCVPAASYWFSATVVERVEDHRGRLLLLAAGSLVFLAIALMTPYFVTDAPQRWWGRFPRYGPAGGLFMAYVTIVMLASMKLLWTAHRNAPADSSLNKRTRLLLIGTAVASLSGIDIGATFGLPLYPISFLPITMLFVITSIVTWTYHLVDITAALAGQKILETMTDALVVVDDRGRVRLINPACEALLGRTAAELRGEALTEALPFTNAKQVVAALERGEAVRKLESTYVAPEGEVYSLSVSAAPMTNRKGRPIAAVYVLCDVTERVRAEQHIRQLAYRDTLTGLANRLRFDEQLGLLLERARTEGGTVTLYCIDLDRFRRVNDQLGYECGDEVLSAAGRRVLTAACGSQPLAADASSGAVVARLGGDTFAVALYGLSQIMDVRARARALLGALSEPLNVDGQSELRLGASIGVTQFPRDGGNVKMLMRKADVAMRHAKDAGRSTFKFFHDSMQSEVAYRIDLESDLRCAAERGEFELWFQPQVDFSTGTVFGSEALLRWRHPERGLVSPAEFIPVAEDTGLMGTIGQWVLKEACRQNKRWHDAGYNHLKIAVNISERQFHHECLVRHVSSALDESGMTPGLLELELTEGIIMRDAENTVFALGELKAMGLRVSVDDFGTGYSSLSYLKRFPIDIIKIDRSFVNDITAGGDDAAITEGIIALTHRLKRHVIAEGVETLEQAHLLHRMGCQRMQGYLFSKPLPAAEFFEFLEQGVPAEHVAEWANIA